MNADTIPFIAPGNFDDFFARLAGNGRASVSRHLAVCEKEASGEHIRLWKRLVGLLSRLTPDCVPIAVARAVRFYIPDGNYKVQVFAVEDLRDGDLSIYSTDVRAAALRQGLLGDCRDHSPNMFQIGVGDNGSNEQIRIESLTTAGTSSAPEYYKHMLDWNRKAIRITIVKNATARQFRAAEALCALAAGLLTKTDAEVSAAAVS